MNFKSINPYNGEQVGEYAEHTKSEMETILENAGWSFESWHTVPIAERSKRMQAAAGLLRENVEKYSRMITLEMGKPISESRAEIRKCAWVCEFYAKNSEEFLADELIESDADESFVSYDPLGTVFAVMPWNFPFWQVFRFAVPTLMAGNTALLKHSSKVFGCAAHIEEIFREAGFPEYAFQNLRIGHDKTERVIAHDSVRAVTLTGSDRAGSSVAMLAGKYLKKSVLELGGSNAFIVLEDAEMEGAVKTAVAARMKNSGQSCIAAKRFILVGNAYDTFLPAFVEAVKSLKAGDPMDESTEIGPLASKKQADLLHQQVEESLARGAELLTGGEQHDAFHQPTVLTDVKPGMPAFEEETFGPLAAVSRAGDIDGAIELASRSVYGLGVTVCTSDIEKARAKTGQIADGTYFINELVKSDPRLPFGGTRRSGYGRELSREGILEFVNKKTVYVKESPGP